MKKDEKRSEKNFKDNKLEINDDLENKLQAAFPIKEAPEQFHSNLKKKILGTQTTKRKRGSSTWMYTVASIAAALILVFTFWTQGDVPIKETPKHLPQLPFISATGPETQGASAGPGYTVELDYRLDGELDALADEAKVYRYQSTFIKENVANVASKLGINGEVEIERWQDEQIYTVGNLEAKSLMVFPTGYFNYRRPVPEGLANRAMPEEEQLVQSAKEYIELIVNDIENVSFKGVEVLEPATKISTVIIKFDWKKINNQLSSSPYFEVEVGRDGEVYGARWMWPEQLISSDKYPLRSVDEAWDAVQADQGTIIIDYSELPFPDGNIVLGSGKIQSTFTGYITTYDNNGEVVLQPVTSFKGIATFDNGVTIPFTVYSEAVKNDYYAD